MSNTAHKRGASARRRLWPGDWVGRVKVAFTVVGLVQCIVIGPALHTARSTGISTAGAIGLVAACALGLAAAQRMGRRAWLTYPVDIAALTAVTLVRPDSALGLLLAGIFARAAIGGNGQAAIRALLYLATVLSSNALGPAWAASPSTDDWRLQVIVAVVVGTVLTRLIVVSIERVQEALSATETLAAGSGELLAAMHVDEVRLIVERCSGRLLGGVRATFAVSGDRRSSPPVEGAVRAVEVSAKGRLLGTLTLPERAPASQIVERTLQALLGQAAATIEAIELRERLNHEATHDPLTGLPNRALFADSVAHSVTERGHAAVVVVEVDPGTTSEQAQVELARRIVRSLRPGDLAAQLGQSRFAVLVLLRTQPDEALAAAAQRLRDAILAADPAGGPAPAGCWIGTAHDWNQHGLAGADVAEALIARADGALARIRGEAGAGGAVAAYDARLDRLPMQRHAEALERGLAEQRLSVGFEPVTPLHDTRSGWYSARPVLAGSMTSAEILAAAAAAGLRARLERWLIGSVQAVLSADPDHPAAVFIPVAGGHLTQAWLVDAVEDVVRAGVAGERIVLELREDEFLMGETATADTIRRLRSRGVGVALAGFGAGTLSLHELGTLPVDWLIVDPRLLDGASAEQSVRMIASIAHAAHQQKLLVVADGVRDPREARLVRAAGCDAARGPLYASVAG
ncbi:EAL domain-containing protein [Dactylosporangium sp. NPDC051541]|uniref:EAL domain-containing protein n=1 Tax=Dactylosporangium sp. NPDC051541 TaxID=3363977 RepID=UPI0037AC42BE